MLVLKFTHVLYLTITLAFFRSLVDFKATNLMSFTAITVYLSQPANCLVVNFCRASPRLAILPIGPPNAGGMLEEVIGKAGVRRHFCHFCHEVGSIR